MSGDDVDFYREVDRCLKAVQDTFAEAHVMLNEIDLLMSSAQHTEIRLLMRDMICEYRILLLANRTFVRLILNNGRNGNAV